MDDKPSEITTIEQKQLSKMEENIATLFKKVTPKSVIKQRPGAGGKMFPYVPIDYVLSELNRVFGIFWEFVVEEVRKTDTSIIVRGKLVVKSPNGFSVSRPGVGRKALTFYKESTKLVDEGNDEKGAVADAIKKAASLFGIAADVYYKELEKYEEIENQQTEDEADKQRAMARYFALAAERGMDGDMAKDKVKTAFKKAHMADLSIAQMEHAYKLLEQQYEVVEAGQEPLRKGQVRPAIQEKPVTSTPEHTTDPGPLPWEDKAQEGEVVTEEKPQTYYCQGPKHKEKNAEQVVVPVGEFCSPDCKEAYWAGCTKSKSTERDWSSLGKKRDGTTASTA